MRRVATLALAMVVVAAALLAMRSSRTDAAWNNPELGRATFTAGVVSPPRNLRCTGGLLSGRVTFNWDSPTGGVSRTGYTWTVTGAATGSGSLAASAITTVQTLQVLTLGTATFTLRANGPGTWLSTPTTVSFTAITGGIIVC